MKTKTGGYLSIATILTICYLLLSEIIFFLEVEQKDEMVVDLNQDKKTFSLEMDIWVGEFCPNDSTRICYRTRGPICEEPGSSHVVP